jgi:hypothetical protein
VRFGGRTERTNDELKAFKPGDTAVLTTRIQLSKDVLETHEAITITDIGPHQGKVVNGHTVPEPAPDHQYISDRVDLVNYQTVSGEERAQLFGTFTSGANALESIKRGYLYFHELDATGQPRLAKLTHERGVLVKVLRSVAAFVADTQAEQQAQRSKIQSLTAELERSQAQFDGVRAVLSRLFPTLPG